MGYTHYYRKLEKTHDPKEWDAFIKDATKIIDTLPIQIGGPNGEGGKPILNKKEIALNGVGEDSHESFVIYRDHSKVPKEDMVMNAFENEIFAFCKTNHKPYDILVTAILALYKHHFGASVKISSDGGEEGLIEGVELVNQTLQYQLTPKFVTSEDDPNTFTVKSKLGMYL